MEPIDASVDRALEWRQVSSHPRAFELTSDAGVCGSLRWEPGRGSLALGKTASGLWSFKRVGFLRPRITVRPLHGETDVAVYAPGLTGGVVHHADGRHFPFARKGLWAPYWAFRRHDGPPFMRFRAAGDSATLGAAVEIEKLTISQDLVPLLALTGWYLIVLAHEDEELAMLTTVITAASS